MCDDGERPGRAREGEKNSDEDREREQPDQSASPNGPGQRPARQHDKRKDEERPKDVRVLKAAGGAVEFDEEPTRNPNSR